MNVERLYTVAEAINSDFDKNNLIQALQNLSQILGNIVPMMTVGKNYIRELDLEFHFCHLFRPKENVPL